MSPERGNGHEDMIDRFWDDLARGGTLTAELDAADAATIRYLHAHDDRPSPDRHFLALLREDLVPTTVVALPHEEVIIRPASPDIGPFPHDARTTQVTGTLTTARGRWLLTQLATAALLLLTLTAGLFAFGRGWSWREQMAPAVMPAISEPPAQPEAIGGSVAQFLWQSTGGPNLPFAELGPPAVDLQGNVWIPDGSHDQFLIFTAEGEFLEAWGVAGSGEGQFEFSAVSSFWGYGGAAFDTAGNIYVLDTGNFRIQKFGPDRTFITAWGGEGSGAGQFRRPSAVAVDDQGHVYVADNGWGTIQVFTDDGSWLDTWSGLGTPDGLAIGRANGNLLDNRGAIAIWVADDGSTVIEFSADGERLNTWQWYGTDPGEFLLPVGVAVDTGGRVYVVDMDAERVQVFSPDGTFLGGWGRRGAEPGQFLTPRGIAFDGQGGIYVTEQEGKRVQKFRLLPPFGP